MSDPPRIQSKALAILVAGTGLQALNLYAAYATYGVIGTVAICSLGAALAVASTMLRRVTCSPGA